MEVGSSSADTGVIDPTNRLERTCKRLSLDAKVIESRSAASFDRFVSVVSGFGKHKSSKLLKPRQDAKFCKFKANRAKVGI